MAIKKHRSVTPRRGRQVALTRGKDKKKPAKNIFKTVDKKEKKKRQWKGLWRNLGKSVTVALVGCVCAVFVLGISLSLLYGYRYMTRSDWFTLKEIEVQGNSRINSREILEIAELDDGANLLALSIEDIKRSLSRNPWVKEVSVRRELPGKLIIGIKERDPFFWMLLEGEIHYADERGNIIAPVVAANFAPLPTLEVETGAEGMAAGLPDLIRTLHQSDIPIDMRTMSFLRLSASRGIELYVDSSQLKIVIGTEEWVHNVDRLNKTLRDLKRRGELHIVQTIKAQGVNVWVETDKGPRARS